MLQILGEQVSFKEWKRIMLDAETFRRLSRADVCAMKDKEHHFSTSLGLIDDEERYMMDEDGNLLFDVEVTGWVGSRIWFLTLLFVG